MCGQPGSYCPPTPPQAWCLPELPSHRRRNLRESLRTEPQETALSVKLEMCWGHMSRDTEGVCDNLPPSQCDEASGPNSSPVLTRSPVCDSPLLKSGQPTHQPAPGCTLLWHEVSLLYRETQFCSPLPCILYSVQKFSPISQKQPVTVRIGLFSSETVGLNHQEGSPGPTPPWGGGLESLDLEHALSDENRVWKLSYTSLGLDGSPAPVTQVWQMGISRPKPMILRLLGTF